MNLWTSDELVKEFVFGKRLARIAAELMGTCGTRLYHDQALYKEAGGGITPWHADQYYWPFASTHTVTAWVPLQAVPLEMGPMGFAAGSHALDLGRDMEIGDASQAKIEKELMRHDLPMDEEPFELGDVSFHAGWTFHRAGQNITTRPREVMTVIYMDQDMRLAAPQNKYQKSDWEGWCPGAKIGERIDTPLNPVLWTRAEGTPNA
jgi:ectoine hydroxylase-related dioxygenase (phytanoyl-CoA dioxygenase family)